MTGFRIEKRDRKMDGSCLVVPAGRLDSDGALKMEDELTGLLRGKSINLTIDFKDLLSISEEGLGMLLGIVSSFREEGGSVDFLNVPGKIDAKIKMIGANKYFEDVDG
ncbi:STAS domain-containing protein [bacterium]|nr:STAS domain-containing protein [bacterium]